MFTIHAFAEGGGGGGGNTRAMRPASQKRNGPQTMGQYIGQKGSMFGRVTGGSAGKRAKSVAELIGR